MSDADLHPTLRQALAQPGNPNATPVEKQTPEDARAEFTADITAVDGPKPEVGEVRGLTLSGHAEPLAARLYVPAAPADAAAPAMLYFHGGGNIRGGLDTHDSTARVLANAGGMPVVSCSYRLAPEHPFPAAVDDALAVARDVVARAGELGLAGRSLIAAGDSAGGNIAAVLALRARDEGGPTLAVQLLIYPVIDHTAETPSRAAFSKGYMLDSMPFYTASYLPDPKDRRAPLASPIHATNLVGLPPAVVLTAGFDPLRDEAMAYASRLEEAGVTVRRLHYPEMIHGFTLLRGLLPEADAALADCARAVRELAAG